MKTNSTWSRLLPALALIPILFAARLQAEPIVTNYVSITATRTNAAEGGDTGPAIVPGEPDKSLLVKAIRYTDPDIRMPPKGKLGGSTSKS